MLTVGVRIAALAATAAISTGSVGRADTQVALRSATSLSRGLAEASRLDAADDGFAAFKARTFKEPFEGGVYIVNGDTPIEDDAALRRFYNREIVGEWKSLAFGVDLRNYAPAIALDAPGGVPTFWKPAERKALRYCVAVSSGPRYKAIVDAIETASAAWEAAADVDFEHVAALDAGCNVSTPGVVFDVRTVDVGGQYFARAFLPRHARARRNLLIDESSFHLIPGKLELVGILRHELGHVLSFRHEQTRPESGRCFEDNEWKPLTTYDAFSVMHYPQCTDVQNWGLQLTATDKLGAACLYGPAAGVPFVKSRCITI
jgi:hypothetical protein